MALQVKFKGPTTKAKPAPTQVAQPTQQPVQQPVQNAPQQPIQGSGGSDQLGGGNMGGDQLQGGSMFGRVGDTLRQNPALVAAMMQFGLNMSAGQPMAQALGGAAGAAGRVANMQQIEAERAIRAGYAAEDQTMQRNRYNMDVEQQAQMAEQRKQQQANSDRSFGLEKQKEERLAKGTPGGGQNTAAASRLEQQWLVARQKQLDLWAKGPLGTEDPLPKMNDAAWVEEMQKKYAQQVPPPSGSRFEQGGGAGATSSTDSAAASAASAAAMEKNKKDLEGFLKQAEGDPQKIAALRQRAKEVGIPGY